MKQVFSDLQTAPLIYFLTHSGVFVAVLGVVFFILGLWFGRGLWGRYKLQTRMLREECEGQRQDIANLKRKLAEQTLRPGTAILPSSTPLITEVLPGVGETSPDQPATATESAPASGTTTAESSPPASSVPNPAPVAESAPPAAKEPAATPPASAPLFPPAPPAVLPAMPARRGSV